MQTFLPFEDFAESARVLDYRRLGKQRVECLQIYNALVSKPSERAGWRNHPAVRMWRGYEVALDRYYAAMVAEWVHRGYKNTMSKTLRVRGRYVAPHWLGDAAFHASHRSNLLRKDPHHYGKFGWSEPPNLEYVWPEGRP